MNRNEEVWHELISVIVPVYNVEKYLDKCIASIVNQTYQELEVILVDDGSSDGCREICDRWAEKDRRINVIHKKNGGLSDARNAGLDVANGEYIGFVDGDDYIHSDMYQKLWETSIGYDADLVMCRFDHVDENGVLIKGDVGEFEAGLIDKREAMNWIVNKGWSCVVWNKLFRSKLFRNIRFPYGKIYEDRMIMPLIIDRSDRIAATTDVLYYYVHSVNGITRSKPSIRKLDKIEAYYSNLRYFEKHYADFSQEIANHMIDNYLLIRDQVGIIPSKDKERMREVKGMVRYCLSRYGKQIRFWHKLNLVCPKLYYFLLHTKRKIF